MAQGEIKKEQKKKKIGIKERQERKKAKKK